MKCLILAFAVAAVLISQATGKNQMAPPSAARFPYYSITPQPEM